MNDNQNLYDVLGVPKDATEEEITAAFRQASREAHPDREGGSHELMVLVNRAGETLRDRLRRQRYDEDGSVSAEMTVDSMGRDKMIGAFTAASLTDADDPLELARQNLLQEEQEQVGLIQNIAHRQQAVGLRRRKLRRIKKLAPDEPDVLRKVLEDLLTAIAKDSEQAIKQLDVIRSARAQLDHYAYHGSMDHWGTAASAFVTIRGPSAADRNATAAKFWKGR